MICRTSFFFALWLLAACTPKTPEAITETQPEPPKPTVNKPCATFDDAPNPDLALENFVLYRDFKKT
ncbi:MAG TPA: hypothetical protein ENJ20_04715, partial [Bacteroidetes bacterium]|nr:hypothetical protein [Bacteroidota bacterium]